MSSEPLLTHDPLELSFHPELERNSQLSSSIRVLNETDDYVAFKLKSTNPKNYVVKPRVGTLLPRSTCEIKVTPTQRFLREAAHNSRCKDKFMIQSAVAAPHTNVEDTRRLFNREAGHPFQESILRVVYSRPTDSSPGRPVAQNTGSQASEANNSVTTPLEEGVQVDSSVAEPIGNDLEEVDVSRNVESILRTILSKFTGVSILREVISTLLILVSLYLMKRTISWIWSLVMFVVMLTMKMVKQLISDSVEDWIVKTLLHITMYILFGRQNNTGST